MTKERKYLYVCVGNNRGPCCLIVSTGLDGKGPVGLFSALISAVYIEPLTSCVTLAAYQLPNFFLSHALSLYDISVLLQCIHLFKICLPTPCKNGYHVTFSLYTSDIYI